METNLALTAVRKWEKSASQDSWVNPVLKWALWITSFGGVGLLLFLRCTGAG